MNENTKQYIDEHYITTKGLPGYKNRDKFAIYSDSLYQLSSEKYFLENQEIKDNFLIIKISDNQFLYYVIIPNELRQAIIQLEQFKENEKIAQVQIEKISSINAKLTFFVILTIINLIASIILALR